MTANSFVNKCDLVIEMKKLGDLFDIKTELIHSPTTYLLCCSNQDENKCEARILGMFSSKNKTYSIKRIENIHSCNKNKKKYEALKHELQKPRYSEMRMGQIVESLYLRFKINYFDVFKLLFKLNTFEVTEYHQNENFSNSLINKDSFFTKETVMESILGGVELLKNKPVETIISESCRFDPFKECLLQLKNELLTLNSFLRVKICKNTFFFKHLQMDECLRDIAEIKIYTHESRIVILGLLFDPNDEYIIQSCLISEEYKNKAIENFLEFDIQVSGLKYRQFFIVDMDIDLIQILRSQNVPFFIKSRAVSFYVQDQKENDPYALEYFNELNYGETEYLEIDKVHYLRKFCPRKMYTLNNAPFPDFEFMTLSVLSMPFIECVTSLIWLISEDIKSKKSEFIDLTENKISEFVLDIIESYEENEVTVPCEVDLDTAHCECGKFQENLYPCIHAVKKIKDLKRDPCMYVSSIYSQISLMKIENITPIVDIKIYPQKTRLVNKRKKTEGSTTEEYVVESSEEI